MIVLLFQDFTIEVKAHYRMIAYKRNYEITDLRNITMTYYEAKR